MTRISIRPHHRQFIERIAAQMGCDQTEALNFLLHELRRQNFSFSSQLPTAPAAPQPPQLTGMFVPFQETMPTVDRQYFEQVPDQEPDEVLAKFLALGMEEF
jgi:hypothetical protein